MNTVECCNFAPQHAETRHTCSHNKSFNRFKDNAIFSAFSVRRKNVLLWPLCRLSVCLPVCSDVKNLFVHQESTEPTKCPFGSPGTHQKSTEPTELTRSLPSPLEVHRAHQEVSEPTISPTSPPEVHQAHQVPNEPTISRASPSGVHKEPNEPTRSPSSPPEIDRARQESKKSPLGVHRAHQEVSEPTRNRPSSPGAHQ